MTVVCLTSQEDQLLQVTQGSLSKYTRFQEQSFCMQPQKGRGLDGQHKKRLFWRVGYAGDECMLKG